MTPSTRAHATEGAIALLLQRIRTTADEVEDRFPLYADPADGRWLTSRRGSWTGGFWAGLLWLATEEEATGNARALPRTGNGRPLRRPLPQTGSGLPVRRRQPTDVLRQAQDVTARLRARTHDDTDTRALTFWYGAAQGYLRCGDSAAADVAAAGAAALAAAAHPRYGVVPAGTALGRGDRGADELTVDSAAAVVALLAWAGREFGQPSWEDTARRHASAVRHLCLATDGGVRAYARLDGAPGEAPAGTWARGQAWGMLALTTAARTVDRDGPARYDGYREAALLAADFWLDRTGSAVPPWSFGDPDGVRDTSAAAIAAEAMLGLAELVPGPRGDALRAAAVRLLGLLVSGHLTTGAAGTPGGPPAGMLLDGCYDMASGTAVAHELIWGDYFLLSALKRLGGSD
ncbi:sugar ABC transporter permease [Streptomyces sp. NBC_00878]|uniref:sugar ABC transporter permease n=1 Tax=Streptomyces sp. NBC_00878 TaxID=2975854 RepID=UPI00225C0DB5|nr:sugar ABC transporter permease [Streptomyces sp. NBC_00878]MCX4904250.1 sugar ABC transporter permease [Streptomyces sp. NBC_00878]